MYKYEVVIYWSDEDNLYIAEVSELAGCMAHGESYEEALQSIQKAIVHWLKVSRENGDSVPQPLPRPLLPAWERPVAVDDESIAAGQWSAVSD